LWAGCKRLEALFGWPLGTLELLCVADSATMPENLIWDWKALAGSFGTERRPVPRLGSISIQPAPSAWIAPVGVRLAAYLTAHSSRLLAGDPVLTAVPSRGPLMQKALEIAAGEGSARYQVCPDR
jgi:hypothetical protein